MTEFVQVLGTVYSIKLVNHLADNTNNNGTCDPILKIIEIEKSLEHEHLKRVLLHELLHAYAHESGLSEFVDHQAEEMFCQSLSGMLNQILEWSFREN